MGTAVAAVASAEALAELLSTGAAVEGEVRRPSAAPGELRARSASQAPPGPPARPFRAGSAAHTSQESLVVVAAAAATSAAVAAVAERATTVREAAGAARHSLRLGRRMSCMNKG